MDQKTNFTPPDPVSVPPMEGKISANNSQSELTSKNNISLETTPETDSILTKIATPEEPVTPTNFTTLDFSPSPSLDSKPISEIISETKTDQAASIGTNNNINNEISKEPKPESKKMNIALFVIIAVILAIAASAITGFLVYSWQLSQIQSLQKEKSLIQSQSGNLKSQLNTLEKELEKQKAINALPPEILQISPNITPEQQTAPPQAVVSPTNQNQNVSGEPSANTPAPAAIPPVDNSNANNPG